MTNQETVNFKQSYYTCYSCRSIHSDLQNLLFVEERSSKGFCKEECIEDFYRPLLKHYEQLEEKLRKDLNLEDETVLLGVSDEEAMARLISAPDEIWKLSNDLAEEIYAYIKVINRAFFIVLCTSYKNEPSYIFLTTKTNEQKILDAFRIGEKLSLEEGVSRDLEEIIERKKSEILARLLEVSTDEADIPMDQYILYHDLFQSTMEEADEIYEYKDRHGDLLVTYTKSFNRNGEAIFYLVICLKDNSSSLKNLDNEIEALSSEEDRAMNMMTIFPIFSFPTRLGSVYKEFKQGKLLSGHLSN